MNDDLESQLKGALRAVLPPEDLSGKVLAQLAARQSSSAPRGAPRRSTWWMSAGIAASLLICLGTYTHIQKERATAAGLEAKREVLQALQLTHQKLDLAYQAVNEQKPASEVTS